MHENLPDGWPTQWPVIRNNEYRFKPPFWTLPEIILPLLFIKNVGVWFQGNQSFC
jgi:hypothetical protein